MSPPKCNCKEKFERQIEELLAAAKAKHQEELEKELQAVKEQNEQARLRVRPVIVFFCFFESRSRDDIACTGKLLFCHSNLSPFAFAGSPGMARGVSERDERRVGARATINEKRGRPTGSAAQGGDRHDEKAPVVHQLSRGGHVSLLLEHILLLYQVSTRPLAERA